MRKFFLIAFLLTCNVAVAQYTPVNGVVQQGGVSVVVGGLPATAKKYLQSFPGATVSVCVSGTSCASLASIFTSATGGSKANPFTSDSTTAAYQFFVAPGTYDLRFSGTGILTPFTTSNVPVPLSSANAYPPINATAAAYTAGCGGDMGCAITNAELASYAQGNESVDARGFACPAQCHIGQANLMLADGIHNLIFYAPSQMIRDVIPSTGKSAQVVYNSNLTVIAYGTTISGATDTNGVTNALNSSGVSNVHWHGGNIALTGPVTAGSAALQIGGPTPGQGLAVGYPAAVPYTQNSIASSVIAAGQFWRGALEHVYVANLAVTASQISTQYTDCRSSLTTCNADIAAAGANHHWTLTETGGTTATDVIGGANGTYTGGYTLNTQAGVAGTEKAAQFDGSTGNVSLPSVSPFTGGAVTVSGWTFVSVQPSNHFSNVVSLVDAGSTNEVEVGYDNITGFYLVVITGGTTYFFPIQQVTLTNNTWMQFAWVVQNNQAFLYINGAPVAFKGSDVSSSVFSDMTFSGADRGVWFDSVNGCDCYIRLLRPNTEGLSFGIYLSNDSGFAFGGNSNQIESPVDTSSPIKLYSNWGTENRYSGKPDWENSSVGNASGNVLAAEVAVDNPGTSYVVNDIVTGSGCSTTQPTFKILGVNASGSVTAPNTTGRAISVQTPGAGCANATEVSTTGGSGSGLKINQHVQNDMVLLDYANHIDAPYEENGPADYLCGGGNFITGSEYMGNGSVYSPTYCPGSSSIFNGPLSNFVWGPAMTPSSIGLNTDPSGFDSYITAQSSQMFDPLLQYAYHPNVGTPVDLYPTDGPVFGGSASHTFGFWGNSTWPMGLSEPKAGTIATGRSSLAAIANPAAPTVTAFGGTGTGSANYGMVCLDGNSGHTQITSPVTSVSGPATLGAFQTLAVAAGGTGYVQGDVGTTFTINAVVGFGASGVGTITQVNGGSGTGPVTGVSLTTPGSGYVTVTGLGNSANGTFPTTGGTGTGLTVSGTSSYIKIAWTHVNGCYQWDVLKADTTHILQAVSTYATGSTDVSSNLYDFGNATSVVSWADTRNTTGDHIFGGLIVPATAGGGNLGSAALPFGSLYLGTAATNNAILTPATFAQATTYTVPDPGVASATTNGLALTVENCGATSGGTQNCAKTVKYQGIAVFGNVTLNGAATQAITTLPFTSGSTYSCWGSDLTNAAGIVSFSVYTSGASATIKESGGGTSDVLYYACLGY